jgi:hypothetical protein
MLRRSNGKNGGQRTRRKWVALIIASLAPGIVLSPLALVATNSAGFGWFLHTVVVFSAAVAMFIALPIAMLLEKFEWTQLGSHIVAGIGLGSLLWVLFVGPAAFANRSIAAIPTYAGQLTLSIVLCVFASTVYWLIARPDKSK